MHRRCPRCQGYGQVAADGCPVTCSRCDGLGRVRCSAARVHHQLARRGWWTVLHEGRLCLLAGDRPPPDRAFLALIDHAPGLHRLLTADAMPPVVPVALRQSVPIPKGA